MCRVGPGYVWTGVMKFVCDVCAWTVRERNRRSSSSTGGFSFQYHIIAIAIAIAIGVIISGGGKHVAAPKCLQISDCSFFQSVAVFDFRMYRLLYRTPREWEREECALRTSNNPYL